MNWVVERVVGSINCGVSFGEVRVCDLNFAEDAASLDEFMDSLVDALGTLSREANLLELQVSWTKTHYSFRRLEP